LITLSPYHIIKVIYPFRSGHLLRHSLVFSVFISSNTFYSTMSSAPQSRIGLIGLAVMGQNLALNIAEKGFDISVYNRTYAKTEDTVKRAEEEKVKGRLTGHKELKDFVHSLAKPRAVIFLVQAGKPVDAMIGQLLPLLEKGDLIIDGGNEWYSNTERRAKEVHEKGIMYMGMGVSGGEEGARHGPSMMPGGPLAAYKVVEPILIKIAAQVNDGPCVTHIGEGGAGNYVKMIHNGIEYGDMQLIAETYDILKNIGGLDNETLAYTFDKYNKSELSSYLIEISAKIFRKKDNEGLYVLDTIKDQTGSKGTGKWTVQEAAENSVPTPTITTALDARYISALLEQRKVANKILQGPSVGKCPVPQAELVTLVSHALYASKICSYTQGMNLIKAAGESHKWNLNLGEISRIWKGGCIIRAVFLDRIKAAYDKNAQLNSLLIDPDFAKEMNERQQALRTVVKYAIDAGISTPAFSASLAYYDAYRRDRLPANLTQAQRDFFGAHTYERIDKTGVFHTEWTKQ